MTGVVEQLGQLIDTLAVWLVAHGTAAALAVAGVSVAVLAVRWRMRAQRHDSCPSKLYEGLRRGGPRR